MQPGEGAGLSPSGRPGLSPSSVPVLCRASLREAGRGGGEAGRRGELRQGCRRPRELPEVFCPSHPWVWQEAPSRRPPWPPPSRGSLSLTLLSGHPLRVLCGAFYGLEYVFVQLSVASPSPECKHPRAGISSACLSTSPRPHTAAVQSSGCEHWPWGWGLLLGAGCLGAGLPPWEGRKVCTRRAAPA